MLSELEQFWKFIQPLIPSLIDIYDYVTDEKEQTEEKEHQLAMDLIRAAKNAEARKEIEGA